MLAKLSFVFLLLALLAEIIGTIGGFGSSVFFVPIANFYFDFHTVLGMTAVFHVFSNLSKIYLFKKGLDKRLVLYLGAPAVLFVIIGGLASKFVAVQRLELILGLFLSIFSLIFLIWDELTIRDGKKEAMVGGALSGFLAGMLGTGGAVRGLTMAAFNLEKSTFVATSAAIDFAVDLSRTVVYYWNGYIQKDILIYIPFLLIIGFVGSYIGKLILAKIPQSLFRKIALFLILAIGLITLGGTWLK